MTTRLDVCFFFPIDEAFLSLHAPHGGERSSEVPYMVDTKGLRQGLGSLLSPSILTLCDVTAQTIAVSVASQLQVAPVGGRVGLQGTARDTQG